MAVDKGSRGKSIVLWIVLMLVLPGPLLVTCSDGPAPAGPSSNGPSGGKEDAVGSRSAPSSERCVIFPAPDKDSNWEFGSDISNMGDVNGDGLEDAIISSNRSIDWHAEPPEEKPGNYILIGRQDRSFSTASLEFIQDMSSFWNHPNQRGIGDVNGDGYADVASAPSLSRWTWGYFDGHLIQLRYGGPDGLANDIEPPSIDARPEKSGHGHVNYGGVGDVNGDGFDDLFVLFHADGESMEDQGMGQMQLYLGSPQGLGPTPNWSMDIPEGQVPKYRLVQGVFGWDLDDGGVSEVVLQSIDGRWGNLEVYNASGDGLSASPTRSLACGATSEYGWDVLIPVEMNGDGTQDILSGTAEDGRMIAFLGGNDGGPVEIKNLTLDGSTRGLRAGDLDGDGLTDLVRLRAEPGNGGSSGGPSTVIAEVFLNMGGRFAPAPSWSGGVGSFAGETRIRGFDTVDLDGDGLDDIVASVSNETRDPYAFRVSILIILSRDIFELARPLRVEGGPVMYAMHQAYDFVVLPGTPSGALPGSARLVLDAGGAAVELRCDPRPGGDSAFREVADPLGCVELRSAATDVARNASSGRWEVRFRVLFGWNWPTEGPCPAGVIMAWEDASVTNRTVPKAFTVENDLAFSGPVLARSEARGPIADGAWVRTGERLTFEVPPLVYEGTTDLHSPRGAFNVTARDDDGLTATALGAGEGPASLEVIADAASDIEEMVVFGIGGLPAGADCVKNATFLLRIDGDLPVFRNPIPDGLDWHSSSNVLVAITVADLDMAGVDGSTLEYSVSRRTGSFGEWTREGLEVAVVGGEVEGMVALQLPDGDANQVRWRAADLVGNGPAISEPFVIRVDTMNVTYSDPFPSSEEWLRVLSVTAGVTIHDENGSGIDIGSVQYRLSPRNLSRYSEWMDWDDNGPVNSTVLAVRIGLSLAESAYTYVQWRAKDVVGHGFTTSPHYRLRADLTPPAILDLYPLEGVYQTPGRVLCWATVSDGPVGSGVNLSTVEFRVRTSGGEYGPWSSLGMLGVHPRTRFSWYLDLPDSWDNFYQLRASDVAGNGPSETRDWRVPVDSIPPELSITSPLPGQRQASKRVTVVIEVKDLGSGIDRERVWVRAGTNGNESLGEWLAPQTAERRGDSLILHAVVDLGSGSRNRLQGRAIDVAGNEVLGPVMGVWVNTPPVPGITEPVPNATVPVGESVTLNGNGSGDTDGDALTYRWQVWDPNGNLVLGTENATVTVHIPSGRYNVTLTVDDGFGGVTSAAVPFQVDAAPPVRLPRPYIELTMVALLAVIITALDGGALAVWHWRRSRAL